MELTVDFTLGDQLGCPNVKIMIDDYMVLHEGKAQTQFSVDVHMPSGFHQLKIVHFGKTDNDHVLNNDGTILIDKFIHIDRIIIDKVKLQESELQQGKFWPVYSKTYIETLIQQKTVPPMYICPNLYLGHNGTWQWDFFYPFVDWVIMQRRPGPNLDDTIFKTSDSMLQQAKDFFKGLPEL